MKLCSKMMLIGCTCIATLALSASVTYGQTGACCLTNDTCQSATQLSCTMDLAGTYQGDGSACGGSVEACCLPDDTCIMADTLCCTAQGGTPQGAGSACTATEACCLPDGTCAILDPLCCTNQGGTPQGAGSVCAPVEGCCLPDATCIDTPPDCCRAAGGTPCGPGNLCLGDNDGNGIDDACETLDHPIPAISNYGLVALLLVTVAAGVIVIRRSRRGHAAA